jgi:N-acetylglucosaminyl-diphospho-decaprenol L-rhamnosyltransferase
VDLSVVIVNWNTRDLLRACLGSLRTALEALGPAAEVIVVDNASADGSAAMVAADFPEVRLLANAENHNYAAGSNQALALAAGSAVLLLNPDTQVPAGAVEALLADLREHPDWGAVAPALVFPGGGIQASVRGFPTPLALAGELTGLARLFPASRWAAYRARSLPLDGPSLVDQPMASAFLVRRAVLEQVGGFDEAFPLFFNDVDLCYRIRRAGWAIAYDPRARITHVGGAATAQVRPEAVRRSHAGLEAFYAKHYREAMSPLGYAVAVGAIRAAGWARAGLARLRRAPRAAPGAG